jgi:hypothetical protein
VSGCLAGISVTVACNQLTCVWCEGWKTELPPNRRISGAYADENRRAGERRDVGVSLGVMAVALTNLLQRRRTTVRRVLSALTWSDIHQTIANSGVYRKPAVCVAYALLDIEGSLLAGDVRRLV